MLASSDGAEAWDALSNTARAFPVHVWVADEPGTVCAWEGAGGIHDMKARLPDCAVRTLGWGQDQG